MFATIIEQLRRDIDAAKGMFDAHDHARELFFGGQCEIENRQVDHWERVRGVVPRGSVWQVYDHCAALTRLYAHYATFVEEITGEYIRVLPELYTRYSELPTAVLTQHRIGVGQILLKLGDSGPYRHLVEKELIERLAAGVSGDSPYVLLNDAFFVDRQNYRLEQLARLLGYLGIANAGRRIAKHPATMSFLEERRGDSATAEAELSRFVQLRNESAHGQVEELIGHEEFHALADFVQTIGEVVGDIIVCEVAQRRIALGTVTWTGEIEKVYRRGAVAIIRTRAGRVTVGDDVALVRGGRVVRSSRIRSIQVMGAEHDSVEVNEGQEIGVGLDCVCKEGMVVVKVTSAEATTIAAVSVQEEQGEMFPEEKVGWASDSAEETGIPSEGMEEAVVMHERHALEEEEEEPAPNVDQGDAGHVPRC